MEYGVKVTGATVHLLMRVPTRPIILQQPVMVKDDDDINSLAQRVLEVEHQLLCRAVKLFIEGRITVRGRKVSTNE